MSAPIYSLAVGEETYSFEQLGITVAALTTNVSAADVLELGQKTDDIPDDLAALLPNKQYVSVLENGAPIFAGRVFPRTQAARSGLRRPYRIVGGWSELTGRFFAQPWAAGTGSGVNFARIGLGVDPATGVLVKTGAVIRAAVNWAIGHGARLELGQVDDGIKIVPEYQECRSCGEVIASALAYTPTMVPFIDYTTETPTFHCVEAAATYTPGALEHGVGVVTNVTAFGALKTVTVARDMWVGKLEVQRCFENDISGVVMTVHTQTLQPLEDVAPGAERKYLTSWLEVKWPESTVLGEDGVVPFVFDGKDFEGYVDLDIEDLLRTQARTLFLAVAQIGWAGSGTIKAQLAPRVPGAGTRLNISGGEEGWAAMNAVIQSARRDLLAGTNTVSWGPPRGLKLDQLLTLALARRKRAAVSTSIRDEQQSGQSGEQNYGFNGQNGTKADTKDNFPLLDTKAWVDVSGVPVAKTIRVRGAIQDL